MPNTINVAAVVFQGNAKNNEDLTCSVTLQDNAENTASITGKVTLSNNAVNSGTINGAVILSGGATNTGTLNGNVTLLNGATNTGTILGDVICSNPSSLGGYVRGKKYTAVPGLSDTSGNSFILTKNGAVTIADEGDGVVASSFATNSYIITRGNEGLDISGSAEYTVEFWIKPNLTGDAQYILSTDSSSAVYNSADSTYVRDFDIYITAAGLLRCLDGVGTELVSPSGAITDGAWMHVAIVGYADRSRRMFINGARAAYSPAQHRSLTYMFKLGNNLNNKYCRSKIAGLHITKEALYDENFTVSTSLPVASDSTVLLLTFGSSAMPSVPASAALSGYYSDGYFVNNVRQTEASGIHQAINETETGYRKYYRYNTGGSTTLMTGLEPTDDGKYIYYGPNPIGSSAIGYNPDAPDHGINAYEFAGTTEPTAIYTRVAKGDVSKGLNNNWYYDYGADDSVTPDLVHRYPHAYRIVFSDIDTPGEYKFYMIDNWNLNKTLFTGYHIFGKMANGVIVAGDDKAQPAYDLFWPKGVDQSGQQVSYYFPSTGKPYPCSGNHRIPNYDTAWLATQGCGAGSVGVFECATNAYNGTTSISRVTSYEDGLGYYSACGALLTSFNMRVGAIYHGAVGAKLMYAVVGGVKQRRTGAHFMFNNEVLYLDNGIVDRFFNSRVPIPVQNNPSDGGSGYWELFTDGVGTSPGPGQSFPGGIYGPQVLYGVPYSNGWFYQGKRTGNPMVNPVDRTELAFQALDDGKYYKYSPTDGTAIPV